MAKSVEFTVGTVKLTISFDTVEELRTALAQVEDIRKVLKENLPEASIDAPKTVRKDLEGIFEYHEGKLVMIKAPHSKVAKVCLALYAIDGNGATTSEIGRISHVDDPSHNVLGNPGYKKYFRSPKRGLYLLNDKGLNFVTNEIIPEIRGKENNAPAQS